MTVYWPVFFGAAALMFVALNAIFAFLYSLGSDPIANVRGDNPLELFYFSIETLATVGYGDMHPQTNYGHFIATVEIFTGMCFLAVLTGLVFARFSRPRARFVFAAHPVVTDADGRPTLDDPHGQRPPQHDSRATARLWLIRVERTKEGDQLRRFYELPLDRSDHPMFVLSWMLFHTIDKNSPLHGATGTDLAQGDASLYSMSADSTTLRRSSFMPGGSTRGDDIRWRHRYRDITSVSPEGRFCSTTPSSTTWCPKRRDASARGAVSPMYLLVRAGQ